LDDDDTKFRTTENGVKFPVDPDKGVKQSCKEHFKEKQQEENTYIMNYF
jgi:hypothetical protein